MRKAISVGRDDRLADLIRACENEGMQDFTKHLVERVEGDMITREAAFEIAPNPDALKMASRVLSCRSAAWPKENRGGSSQVGTLGRLASIAIRIRAGTFRQRRSSPLPTLLCNRSWQKRVELRRHTLSGWLALKTGHCWSFSRVLRRFYFIDLSYASTFVLHGLAAIPSRLREFVRPACSPTLLVLIVLGTGIRLAYLNGPMDYDECTAI